MNEVETELEKELDAIKEDIRNYLFEKDRMEIVEKWVLIQKRISALRKSL